jgi:hypothetical protein
MHPRVQSRDVRDERREAIGWGGVELGIWMEIAGEFVTAFVTRLSVDEMMGMGCVAPYICI